MEWIKEKIKALKVHITFNSIISVIYMVAFIHSVHINQTDLNLLIVCFLSARLHEVNLILKHSREAALDILKQIRDLKQGKK